MYFFLYKIVQNVLFLRQARQPKEGTMSTTPPLTTPTTADRLQAYLQCEQAILSGHQSYTLDGVTFTRADLYRVQQAIAGLRAQLASEQAAAAGGGAFGIHTTGVIF